MELNICHLYPDILNLYGDRGNVLCLRKRLGWRGIDANVEEVSIGQKLEASKYDLLFIGGGQDFEQEVLLPDLRGEKRLKTGFPCSPSAAAIRCWGSIIRRGTACSATLRARSTFTPWAPSSA